MVLVAAYAFKAEILFYIVHISWVSFSCFFQNTGNRVCLLSCTRWLREIMPRASGKGGGVFFWVHGCIYDKFLSE